MRPSIDALVRHFDRMAAVAAWMADQEMGCQADDRPEPDPMPQDIDDARQFVLQVAKRAGVWRWLSPESLEAVAVAVALDMRSAAASKATDS
jgi:hypothetical protein